MSASRVSESFSTTKMHGGAELHPTPILKLPDKAQAEHECSPELALDLRVDHGNPPFICWPNSSTSLLDTWTPRFREPFGPG